MPSARRVLAGSAPIGLAAAWAVVCGLVYRRAFGASRVLGSRAQVTPADFGMPHESLDAVTSDGLRLAAWYLPGTRPAAVVVSGGYRGRAGDVLGVSSGLQRAGFHVAVYGWRGTPGSDAAAHTLGVHERRDLLSVVDAMAGRLGDVPIGLLGYSLGGAVSISVGADDPRVRAVCADSAFADPTALLADRVRTSVRVPAALLVAPAVALLARRTGARLADFRPVQAVARIAPRPLLIIHGAEDAGVPVHHAERLFSEASEPKELWRLAGVGHVGAYWADRTAYMRRLTAFFEAALLGEPRPELLGDSRTSAMSL